MSYSIDLLTSESACDDVITDANARKSDLEFRLLSTNRQKESVGLAVSRNTADVAAVEAELDTYNDLLSTLPDGLLKDEITAKKVRAEFRLFTLQQRNLDPNRVLFLELQAEGITADVARINAFIAEVQARKATFN